MAEPTALPVGRSCGECIHFTLCRPRFHRLANDTDCEHAPSIFRALPQKETPRPMPPSSRNIRVLADRMVRPDDALKDSQKKRRRREKKRRARLQALVDAQPAGRFVFGSLPYQSALPFEGGAL